MAKMKIFELKNEINKQIKGEIESKDILDYLEKSFGVKKTHSSNLEDNEIQVIKNHFIKGAQIPVQISLQAVQTKPEEGKKQTSVGQSTGTVQKTAASSNAKAAQAQTTKVQSTPTQNANVQPQRQGQPGGQRPAGETGHQGTAQTGQRPAGGQNVMRQGQQGYQGQSNAGQRNAQGQGYQSANSNANTSAQRTTTAGQRPVMQSQQNNQNQMSGHGHQTGQNQQVSSNQQGYQRQQNPNQARQQRPQQEGYQGRQNQTSGYQSSSGYQGQRSQRPQGEGYQGQRQQRPAGQYQGGQNQQGGYQAQGDRRPQQGQSGYQGQGAYRSQGNNPQGDRRPQQGQSGYQGQGAYRSQGERPQGDRSQSGDRSGFYGGQQRSNFSGNSGYNRQGAGQKTGGFAARGFEDSGKDDDDKPSYGNKAQGKKGAGSGRGGSERKNFDQKILDQKVAEKNDNSNKRNRDRINKEKNYKDRLLDEREIEDDEIKAKLLPKKGQFIQPKPVEVVEEEIKVITIPEVLTIKELAEKMKKPSAALIKKLFLSGKIVTLNQEITFDEAEEIALEYDIIAEKEVKVNEVEELLKEEEEDPSTMVKRPPVVCVMGHVDHGKTSLLDAIRETNVTSREAGGITQHIGAYVVEVNGEKITFLDTPGHEAFTAMRMRGAKSTDIAILVVAADDGVMPQTVEAINHAKAAGVQIIVAINKIDKPSANIERVKQELTEYELIAEDWGGDTIFVPVSAHTKEGIDQLLEMILLTAEIMELKANPNRNARGIVIEAELDKGRGPVATILVQKGTLHVGDNVVVGSALGKVRAMNDDNGHRVKEAGPSTPVEILGLNAVPDAGETLLVTANEKEARTIANAYLAQGKEKLLADTKAKLSLDGLFSQIQAGNIKELNLIIKADVQGSVEAMKQSLLKLSNDEVAVRVIHSGVGAINESDVILASTSNAIIIGFNVKPDNAAKDTADREKVDVKLYRVIYNAINDVEAAMKGMLDPVYEEKIIGHAEIRMTFKASGVGTIAGAYVLDGKIVRGSKARIYRDNSLVYDGALASLKRFQDDVKEVATGYECGLVFEKFNDVKEGDRAEFFIMAEVPR
jgi:translation initiation factor IF-2